MKLQSLILKGTNLKYDKKTTFQKINILAGLLMVLFLVSCSEKDPAADYPLINLQDESQTRTSTESVLRFSISLSKPSSEEVSVDYLLKDGTALAGKDFICNFRYHKNRRQSNSVTNKCRHKG